MLQPVNDYETEYNKQNAACGGGWEDAETCPGTQAEALEDKVAKGNAKPEELKRIAQEVADLRK